MTLQLWAPPEVLRLVRSTFVPLTPPQSAALQSNVVVLVVREPDESRSLMNEQEVVDALERACHAHNATLTG